MSNTACYTCDTDLCNTLSRADHTCLVCSSSTDAKCLNEPPSVTHTRCPISYTTDAFCFTKLVNYPKPKSLLLRRINFFSIHIVLTSFHFLSSPSFHGLRLRLPCDNPLNCCANVPQNSDSTTRGCLTTNREVNDCANNQQKCSWCNVNENGACNTDEFPLGRRQCLHCDSHSDKNCPANVTHAASQSVYCNNIHDTCITINRGALNGLLQTCVEKISSADNEFCTKHKDSCILCTENNCNWKKPAEPSSSNRIGAVHAMTLVVIAVASFLLT